MSKRKVRVEVYNSENDCTELPENLIKYRDWLDSIIQKIPVENLNTAIFEDDSYASWDSVCKRLIISYEREETDEEYAKRVDKEEFKKRCALHRQEQQEHEQLIKLKAKYEGK